MADALRASNLPAYGYFRDTAPNLTALGRHATVFRNHLANYPGTPVSVSQILTGRLMSPLLLHADLAVVPVKAIPRDLAVLPRVLREAGYRTGIVTGHPFLGQARLTQEFEGRFLVGPRGRAPYASLRDMMGPIQAFLGQASSDPRPFFLYVHPMDTHGPLQPHRRFARFRGQPAPPHYDEYDENILFTDHWVGRILAEIEDLGLADRTVFVFTSDHGEEFNEAGPGYWNAAHGYTLRRAQLHVPLIIRVPDDPRPGREYASLT
ncbi:MAG TPA: sulfatase, partial [Vicinamibacteria bacterium]|nr:sulfatase [Vicinamibacteria bacterium]